MDLQFTRGVIKVPQKVLLYGTPGIGKTHFCSLIENGVFVDLEKGTNNFDVLRAPPMKTTAELFEFIKAFASEAYTTLIIDSLTALERIFVKDLLDRKGWDNLEKPGYGKGYEELKQDFIRFINAMDFLIARGKNVVLIGHSRIRTFQDPMSEAYDRYEPECTKQVSSVLIPAMDAVFFYKWRSITVETEKGDRFIAKGSGDRELYAVERPSLIAKNRTNMEVSYINPTKEFWKCL